MTKNILIICILFFLISCSKKQDNSKLQNNVLDKKKFVSVLVDCYLIEGTLVSCEEESTHSKDYSKYYYDYMLKKHNVTRTQIFESMQYYCFKINELTIILNETNSKISMMQVHKKKENENE